MKADAAWEPAFIEAVQQESVTEMMTAMKEIMSTSEGTTKQRVKHRALLLIEAEWSSQPDKLHALACSLAEQSEDMAQELAVFLLSNQYHPYPDSTAYWLKKLAISSNKEVREWSGGACGIILSKHFDTFYPELLNWTTDPSPFIRGAALAAAKYASATKNAAYAERLLDLVEPLLSDPEPYVKKQLGASAIGEGLLRYYPQQVICRLEQWIQLECSSTRWNIAKLYTTAEAVQHWEQLRALFIQLLNDDRSIVRKAVQGAVKKLEKRIPADPLWQNQL